jgi:exonuclease V
MVNLFKKYRPYGIAVTDLSAQLWCEKQLEFSLEKGRLVTDEMDKGRERHRGLHEEVAILVKVKPKTIVDALALRLHNQQVGLVRLLQKGMTRELPIFGIINSLFVTGYIDELDLKQNKLFILDTKTRKSNTMPSEAQKRTIRFQLITYNKLLKDLILCNFSPSHFLKFYGIKNSEEISDVFKKSINDLGDYIEPNISRLVNNTFKLFRILPLPERVMSIRYESQIDSKIISVDKFSFDDEPFQRDCNFVEEFWLGERRAIPVGTRNAWKCRYCEFINDCEEKPAAA